MKTKLFLIGMLSIIGLSVSAQGTWGGLPSYGGAATGDAVGFTIGDTVYVGTGAAQPNGEFYYWEPVSNSWHRIANFGGGHREDAVAFSIGSYGYVGTGTTGPYYQDFWQYNPNTNTWTQIANFPGGPRAFAVGFSICDKGYVGTGYDGTNYYDDFYEYDPGINGWTLRAPYPGDRSEAVGFSIGNKGYIGIGFLISVEFPDFSEYDPTNNTWTRKADFAGGLTRANAVGFSIGNKGYIGTGDNCLDDFWEWNQATNTWAQKTNYTRGVHNAVGVSTGSRGYIATGNACNFGIQDFNQYIPDTVPGVAFLPNRSPICVSDSCISFTDASTTAPTTWIWSFQGGSPDTSTVQNPSNICFRRGTDTITLTASNCNYSNTAKFILSVQACTGIAQVSNESKITIYPNPFSSETTIIIEKELTDATLNIYDVFGRKVKQIQNISGQQITINRNGLSNGIYFIRLLQDGETIWIGKVVITD